MLALFLSFVLTLFFFLLSWLLLHVSNCSELTDRIHVLYGFLFLFFLNNFKLFGSLEGFAFASYSSEKLDEVHRFGVYLSETCFLIISKEGRVGLKGK